MYEVKAPSGEVGKLIGKKGRIAKTLRELMSSIGHTHHRRILIEIVEKRAV